MNQENVYNVTAYSLWDFLCEIQKAVQDGFVLSSHNSHFPQGFISLYTCTLVKEDKPEVEITQEITEPVKEVTLKDVVTNSQVKNTAGRKARISK